MKFLLLFIGLACCIVDLFLGNDVKYKIKNNNLIAIGILLIIANIFYLWLGLYSAIFVILFFLNAILYKGHKFNIDFSSIDNLINKNLDMGETKDNHYRFGVASIILIVSILPMIFMERYLPPVTLENDIIKAGGSYGRYFIFSEIQAIDTVSVIPRIGMMSHGRESASNIIGYFDLANESKTANLRIWLNNPPYIMIRMNDNSLFIFNFKKPDKTVEFYQQLKNAL